MPNEKSQVEDQVFDTTQDSPPRPKSFKESFMRGYYNVVPYFNVNLAWAVMSLPVLTLFPALGGLYSAALMLAKGDTADWGVVWRGFKDHWWLSLRWGLLVLFGDVILLANIWFYLNLSQSWAIFPLVICVFLLIFWLVINQFSFPLLLMQEEKKIFLAIRNGYVIVMRKPLAALKMLLINTGITIVSILLPPLWIFISMSLICYLQSREVLKAVEGIRQKDADLDAAAAHREGDQPEGEEDSDSKE